MTNKIRKITVVLLAAVLAFSASACGKDGGGKVTLKWATGWSGQSDDSVVLKTVNEKLDKVLPGINIEFVPLSNEKWASQMSAGEEIDIAWTGYTFDMGAEITNGSYLSLNDYISEKETPNLWKEWKEDYVTDYGTSTVDGKLYALPNQQPLFSETPYVSIPAELMEYFPVDAFIAATYASPTTTRQVYEVLEGYFKTIFDNDLDDTDTVGTSIDIFKLYQLLAMRGYGSVGAKSNLVYKLFEDNPKIESIIDTDEYKLFIEYAAKWYQEGYIAKDVMVSTGSSGSRLSVITGHVNGIWFNLSDEDRGITTIKDQDGIITNYQINIEPKDLSHKACGCSILGSTNTYTAVPYTTKHPAEAVKLLDLLRSPIGTEGNEILNLLVYGIEGKHYDLEGDDLALGKEYLYQPEISVSYGKPHWVMGNVFLMYRTPNIAAGQNEYAQDYFKNRFPKCHKSAFFDFRMDLSSLKTQLGNVSSAVKQYDERLQSGVDGANYMSTFNEYQQKLQVAGINDMRDAAVKQTKEYVADSK